MRGFVFVRRAPTRARSVQPTRALHARVGPSGGRIFQIRCSIARLAHTTALFSDQNDLGDASGTTTKSQREHRPRKGLSRLVAVLAERVSSVRGGCWPGEDGGYVVEAVEVGTMTSIRPVGLIY